MRENKGNTAMKRRFSEVLAIINGRNQKKVENPQGKYPIYGSGGIMGHADDYLCEENTVIIGRKGNINKPLFVKEKFWNVDTAFGLAADCKLLHPKYLYYFCCQYDFERLNKTVTIPSLTKSDLLEIELELPPLKEQEEVAAKLEQVDLLIDKCRQRIEIFDMLVKSRFVEMFGEPHHSTLFPYKKVRDFTEVRSGGTPSRKQDSYWTRGGLVWQCTSRKRSCMDNR